MNDFDLESKLKSVPLPERPKEYWDDFPSRVRVQLHRKRPEFTSRCAWRPRLEWAGGFALACLIFGLTTLPAFHAVLNNEKAFRRELAQLPGHLRVLMQDEHGMHYLIADQP